MLGFARTSFDLLRTMLCLRGDSKGSGPGTTSPAPDTPPAQTKRSFKPASTSLLMNLPSELLDRLLLSYGPDAPTLSSMALTCHSLKAISEVCLI